MAAPVADRGDHHCGTRGRQLVNQARGGVVEQVRIVTPNTSGRRATPTQFASVRRSTSNGLPVIP